MKYCPNVECPHYLRQGVFAEYADGENVCLDCGTSLVDERPIFPSAENGWIAVTNPLLSIEAQILCDRLLAKGISAYVTDDTVSSFFILTTFGGAQVMVREQDVEQALALLGQAE